ncbi:exodeoxyribonuclease III [Geminocystis sp. NIES-3709]|uniref:exodeoxyribonuclease III n=1 Tax=Geminocystis sp. NIES-3709 TaxID=1617448 RepID=UPI0005FC6681|nr:exodeoxyribonuclease III [Geminocystis sp. NIES-3709]BAQ66205.1 exodeoxyribonuclease III [Geminocystis sp. NIES-3709]
MKIATWNVNSIRTRQEQVKQWLIENDIDVICLQETKVVDADFPVEDFKELGYHTYIYGQKAYNGVAIFSRQVLEDVKYGFANILPTNIVDNFDEQKRVISGVINNIRIVNLYVPNGNSVGSEKYEYKLAWLDLLKQYLTVLKEEYSEELLVCGDFNIALEDIDIYKSIGKENHIMASKIERETLKSILNIGLTDIFRKFTSEGNYFSWWDYRQGGFSKNRGWRIDHVYLTDKLAEKAVNCYIDIEPRKLIQPSDHAPVICEF